jgi:hypothetical protein
MHPSLAYLPNLSSPFCSSHLQKPNLETTAPPPSVALPHPPPWSPNVHRTIYKCRVASHRCQPHPAPPPGQRRGREPDFARSMIGLSPPPPTNQPKHRLFIQSRVGCRFCTDPIPRTPRHAHLPPLPLSSVLCIRHCQLWLNLCCSSSTALENTVPFPSAL